MKKGLMFGFGFVFVFLFVQTFVFAAEVGPVISNVTVVPHMFSATVSFKLVSAVNISSCSISLNSANGLIQKSFDSVNSSKINRLAVSNLSASTNYTGEVSCLDSSNLRGESTFFNLVTLDKVVNNTTNNRTTARVNNTTNNRTTARVNNTVAPSQQNNLENSSSFVKKAVLGASAGIGILLIIGGIVYFVRRSHRN